jgi:hypothetical protein
MRRSVHEEKRRRQMKASMIIAMVVVLGAVMGLGQQVVITSFQGNGSLTFTTPTSNAVSAIEWAPNLTSGWQRDWTKLKYLQGTSASVTVAVPMFYRVSSQTNGLFTVFPPGREIAYWSSNMYGFGEITTQRHTCFGCATPPGLSNEYVVVLGRSDETHGASVGWFRSTPDATLEWDTMRPWFQKLHWTNGPIGTTFDRVETYSQGLYTNKVTIATQEVVTVPAGSFFCVKYAITNLWGDSWEEWVAPGLWLIKGSCHRSGPGEGELRLESWTDN